MRAHPKPARSVTGFTLIELLAVMVIIALLVGILIGTAGYVQKKAATQTARADIAAMELALESYKIDNGTYPSSTIFRVSSYGSVETANSAALYRALAGGSKKYIKFRASQLQRGPITGQINVPPPAAWPNTISWTLPLTDTTGVTNYIILDPWGHPYNYYYTNPLRPTVTATIFATMSNPTNGVVGGQVNLTSFDLMSYGPDLATYAPSLGLAFAVPTAANDDVNNFH